ncbi:MAG: agmatinase [Bacteroidetes bacterium]|nr:agmatinase [Rhodothermia bacterium]MCS7155172.1 agmatinase [Bacteroidota bacterium]MCX7906201.1 agmatinase [Bacteroidota bacterium]MDW8138328.1 agmatinase [Bacteroidota bacterium]MDW8286013.1 agmatinase [Bacteroidota bacterium]
MRWIPIPVPAERAFLAPPPEAADFARARVVVLPAPYEHTSSFVSGSAAGPGAIIEVSAQLELYDAEFGVEIYERAGGIATLEPLDFTGRYDAEAVELVEEAVGELLDRGKFVVLLGAEHTVTLGAVRAYAARLGPISVLQIDAHSDLRQQYQDNPYSHACVMARVLEVPGVDRLAQVGVRAQCRQEAEWARTEPRIRTWYAHALKREPDWIEQVLEHLGERVYLSIDADGIDPSILPAVGTPVPNGLSWAELTALLCAVAQSRQVVGFDFVELAPRPELWYATYTAAEIVHKTLGYLFAR